MQTLKSPGQLGLRVGLLFFILRDDGRTDGNFGSFNYGINNSQTGFRFSFVGTRLDPIRLSSLGLRVE